TLINTEIERQYDNFSFELLSLDLAIWLRFFLLQTNAALRGEQRKPPNLSYCAINTKAKL
ncbi:hypothetical protein ACEV9Z_13200, partial [Vibrio parahaemolyticus]